LKVRDFTCFRDSAEDLVRGTVFNGKHIYVTWSKSTIDDKDEFHQKLLAILPVGVRVFGERELRADSTLSYHAMISFVEKMQRRSSRSKETRTPSVSRSRNRDNASGLFWRVRWRTAQGTATLSEKTH